ncbi:MAG: TetR/AcrR family transcriptional regulator [Rhodopseudomonas palustris]|uniref:TetR/AcrR family transcriptional regulator n=1 Tax=Rhodopseudomonas palustris TaxID=1076 RepID=A0A933S5C4_RHOPL|nr:TetR/AcrR family transcriptional regulator [Rhodopseudomonas palustris]
MQKKATLRAGRPRDENVHRAILEATRDLIREEGYSSFSIEGVAARAGVAKQSIYRRWASKGALLVDLYMDGLQATCPAPPGGFAVDLLAVMLQTTKRLEDAAYKNLLKGLVIEAQTDPEIRKMVLERIIEPRRQAAMDVIRRAVRSGELMAGVDADMLVDFVFGAVWFNLLLGEATADNRLARRMVDTIQALMAPSTTDKLKDGPRTRSPKKAR